jgi:TetR/AcrR family transcriptional regulator
MVKMYKKEIPIDTEAKILAAAKYVFYNKGLDGARMQEIADEAGINKALLHYYFRTKEKLFLAIFADAFQNFFPKVQETLILDIPFTEKIRIFIDKYLDLLMENPYLPGFILSEINRNPEKIVSNFLGTWFKPELLFKQIQTEMDLGKIRPMDPRHLIISIVAMCVFPFIGKKFITYMLFENELKKFDSFIKKRKEEVTLMVMNAIEIKESTN